MHTPAVALPEDDDRLARLAADADQPDSLRRQAFQRLIPTIEWVARRVSIRFAGQWRGDVLTDAPGDIWAVIAQFPPGGRFEPWCYVVLRNRWFDEAEKASRRRELDALVARSPASGPDLQLAVERSLDASEPFGQEDLLMMGNWPPRDRLALLCVAGLWQKVPTPDWRRWVAEHRDRFGSPAGEPFPPDALAACDQIAERNELLSAALNIKRNTLSVLLYRGKARLLELAYVRDRLDLPGGTPP
jgi:DNA-directed RNA polymerase specialized sigma24 family protein